MSVLRKSLIVGVASIVTLALVLAVGGYYFGVPPLPQNFERKAFIHCRSLQEAERLARAYTGRSLLNPTRLYEELEKDGLCEHSAPIFQVIQTNAKEIRGTRAVARIRMISLWSGKARYSIEVEEEV